MNKFSLLKGAGIACLAVLLSVSTAFAQDQARNASTFLSPEKEAPMPFTGLGLKWHEEEPEGTSADLFVRFFTDEEWGGWNEIEHDIDGDVDVMNPEAFIATDIATAFQYKVVLISNDSNVSPVFRNPEFTYIKAHEFEPEKVESMSASIEPVETGFLGSRAPALRVISRSEWGADESLRLYTDDRPEPQLIKQEPDFYKKYAAELKLTRTVATTSEGKLLTWPLEYPENITKIIIHHTATSKNLDNPKQAIRDIYYWHSITRGWGDIGYNYIVDQQGNIYEGRYGGDGVVGAHAGPANVGSIGIAVLGNYEEEEVPESVMSSLAALMKAKSTKYGIDTMGTSSFRGEIRPNIIGHRDVMATSCPGDNLYAALSTLKALSKNAFTISIIDKRRDSQKDLYDFDIAEDTGIVQMNGGEKETLAIKIKNTGSKEWGEDTYFMLSSTKSTQKYLASSRKSWKSGTARKTVKKGETATFHLPLIASHTGGFTTFEAFPMIDGSAKLEKYVSIPVQIKGSDYNYELVDVDIPKEVLKKGEEMDVTITLKNTGDTAWKRIGSNKVMIGTENPRDHISRVLEKPASRLAGLTEGSVKPGETGEFVVHIVAPSREGQYREYYAPVIEGITWMPHRNNYLEFYVSDTNSGAKYTGSRFSETFQPGEQKEVTLSFQNTGTSTWQKEGASAFRLVMAKNASLAVTGVELQEDQVKPGEEANVKMSITAPTKEGIFRIIAMPKAGAKSLTLRPIPMYIRVSRTPITETRQVSSSVRVDDSNDIRIGIGFEGDPDISSSGSFMLLELGQRLKSFAANEKVSVTYQNGKYEVKGDNAAFVLSNPPRFEPVVTGQLRIDNYENHPGWKPELNDNTYRGALEVHWYENKLVVVNELPLEDYLKGLAEIDASQHFEKIKSIIILARSYAKYYMTQDEKFPGAPFHLSDDPQRSQFYLGYGFEVRNQTGVRAVEATAGEVVTYNGQVIKTPYFSASDGRTRSAEEVWGWTNTPYLKSVDDPGCEGEELRGHGVGLSGCGSLYWAEKGKDYKEIIKYYFQGVEVERK